MQLTAFHSNDKGPIPARLTARVAVRGTKGATRSQPGHPLPRPRRRPALYRAFHRPSQS